MTDTVTPYCPDCGKRQRGKAHRHATVWAEATYCDQCGTEYGNAAPPTCPGCGAHDGPKGDDDPLPGLDELTGELSAVLDESPDGGPWTGEAGRLAAKVRALLDAHR